MTLVRPGLPHGVLTAAELRETPDGARVSVAGPGSRASGRRQPGHRLPALEDETGMVNCIVRPEVYDRHRAVVRATRWCWPTGVWSGASGT